jgi:predicted transglutaminase-like cysteine proteinase
MLNLSRAQRTVALSAVGLGLCLSVLFHSGLTKAKELSPPPNETSVFVPAPEALSAPATDISLSTTANEALQVASREAPETTLLDAQRPISQPFGFVGSAPLERGGVRAKWQAAKAMLRIEEQILKNCRADIENCPPAAKLFLDIIDEASTRDMRARIGEINRAINATIRPTGDLKLYGVQDLWATPLTSLAARAGDCEDYAIAKYVALRESGFSGADLRLVIVQDSESHHDHAVAAVKFEGHWLVLDNLRYIVQQDTEVSRLTPLYFIDDDGVKNAIAPSRENTNPILAMAASLEG